MQMKEAVLHVPSLAGDGSSEDAVALAKARMEQAFSNNSVITGARQTLQAIGGVEGALAKAFVKGPSQNLVIPSEQIPL